MSPVWTQPKAQSKHTEVWIVLIVSLCVSQYGSFVAGAHLRSGWYLVQVIQDRLFGSGLACSWLLALGCSNWTTSSRLKSCGEVCWKFSVSVSSISRIQNRSISISNSCLFGLFEGLRAEEASCGWVSAENGRTVWMCSFYSQPG